jgi:hypothetical protein
MDIAHHAHMSNILSCPRIFLIIHILYIETSVQVSFQKKKKIVCKKKKSFFLFLEHVALQRIIALKKS